MRRVAGFNEGAPGMSENSCFAKRVGSVDQARSTAGNRSTWSSTGSGYGSYEVEAIATTKVSSPYIAIDTVSGSPLTIIKHVANWPSLSAPKRGSRGEYVRLRAY